MDAHYIGKAITLMIVLYISVAMMIGVAIGAVGVFLVSWFF